jgi:hypothetical protein
MNSLLEQSMPAAPNLIELLGRKAPDVLIELRAAHLAQGALFSSKAKFGSPDTGKEGQDQRAATLDLIQRGIEPVASSAQAITTRMRTASQRVSRIRFVGALVATISGGITGILALFVGPAIVQSATAFSAMLGGIAAVTADQFELSPSGLKIASPDEYAKIVEVCSNLEVLRIKIAQDSVRPLDTAALDTMLDSLNDCAIKINRWKLA